MLQKLYEKGESSLNELASGLNEILQCNISEDFINFYYGDRQEILKNDNGMINLSPEARALIELHHKKGLKEKEELEKSIQEVFDRYNVHDLTPFVVISQLEKIYKDFANKEINPKNGEQLKGKTYIKGLETLNQLLNGKTDEPAKDNVAKELLKVSGTNSYLTKMTHTYLFSGLLKSKALNDYMEIVPRKVWIDTQVLLPLICVLYSDNKYDYEDFQYNAAFSLFDKAEQLKGKVEFVTSDMYVEEVAAHFWEAQSVSKLETLVDIPALGGSRNIFYNYYCFLVKSGLEHFECFSDFIEDVLDDGEEWNVPRKEFVENATKFIRSNLQLCNISVYGTLEYNVGHEQYIKEFIKSLESKGKTKSYTAAKSDVKSVLVMTEKSLNTSDKTGLYTEPYLVTWDSSLRSLNENYREDANHGSWKVFSPIHLANKLSIMNFKVDPSLISFEIVSLTEKNFSSANDKRRFIDTLALFVTPQTDNSWVLGKKLIKLKEEQVSTLPDEEIEKLGDKNSLDAVLTRLYEFYSKPNSNPNFDLLTKAMQKEENTEILYDLIKKACLEWNDKKDISEEIKAEINKIVLASFDKPEN